AHFGVPQLSVGSGILAQALGTERLDQEVDGAGSPIHDQIRGRLIVVRGLPIRGHRVLSGVEVGGPVISDVGTGNVRIGDAGDVAIVGHRGAGTLRKDRGIEGAHRAYRRLPAALATESTQAGVLI